MNVQPESEPSNSKEVALPPESLIAKPRGVIILPEPVVKNTVLTTGTSRKMLVQYLYFETVLSNDDLSNKRSKHGLRHQ